MDPRPTLRCETCGESTPVADAVVTDGRTVLRCRGCQRVVFERAGVD